MCILHILNPNPYQDPPLARKPRAKPALCGRLFVLGLVALLDFIASPILWFTIPFGHPAMELSKTLTMLNALTNNQWGSQWMTSAVWLWSNPPGLGFWTEQTPFYRDPDLAPCVFN